jgi:hypothetical protein
MNIFGFITIGLVFVSVLLIYYVEIPRLRREIIGESTRVGVFFSIVNNHIKRLDSQQAVLKTHEVDLEAIKSARGTFSRQLDHEASNRFMADQAINERLVAITTFVHSDRGVQDSRISKLENELYVYLDSHAEKVAGDKKKKKSGK